jgi:hypothetical protein
MMRSIVVVALLALSLGVLAVEQETQVANLEGLLSRGFADSRLSGWNPELKWSEVEPSEGVYNFNVVDDALAKKLPIRLRVWAGIYTPKWMKDKLGTVTIEGSQSGSRDTMVPFWKDDVKEQYWKAYEDLQAALKNHVGESNPLIRGVQISGTMFVYSEPFLHQFGSEDGSKFSINSVKASGWTVTKDKAAQIRCLDIHKKVWTSMPQLFAFNAYQSFDSSLNVHMDAGYVKKFIKIFRSKFGRSRAVIANHSIRESYIGFDKKKSSFYQYLKKAGTPLYFHTATWDRIAKRGVKATKKQRHTALIKVMDWALKMGAVALELPAGHNLKASEINKYNKKFKKN